MNTLHFSVGTNSKLGRFIDSLSLPAGYTCPNALTCQSFADRKTGKITDGKHCKVRCYAASMECQYPPLRKKVWDNYDLLMACKTKEEMVELIQRSLPKDTNTLRPGVNGDYFIEMYFDAWIQVAINNPHIHFYSYTKMISWWLARRSIIPKNLVLTASMGGKEDHLIKKNQLKFVEIVFSVQEAKEKGLEIDHDDSHAYKGTEPFCVIIHGTQPANSEAGKAWQLLKKQGIGGYGKQKAKRDLVNIK